MKNAPFYFLTDAFTRAELERIVELGDQLTKTNPDNVKGKVGDRRHCELIWMQHSECGWFFQRMNEAAALINQSSYQLALSGIHEPLQYTTYGPGDHFSWHMDRRAGTAWPRKLSMSLQLSDPLEYEGGELELLTGTSAHVMEKWRGMLIVFPSWTLHRVTPVTKGTRKSLVAWVGGPDFK